MDGMPRSGGDEDKMLLRLIRIESMERREAILVRKVTAARVKAYQICRAMMDPKMRLFFEAYYADMQSIDTARKISGADDQTARVYLKMLKEDK